MLGCSRGCGAALLAARELVHSAAGLGALPPPPKHPHCRARCLPCLQFEKEAEEADPFGLDAFLSDVRSGRKKVRQRLPSRSLPTVAPPALVLAVGHFPPSSHLGRPHPAHPTPTLQGALDDIGKGGGMRAAGGGSSYDQAEGGSGRRREFVSGGR